MGVVDPVAVVERIKRKVDSGEIHKSDLAERAGISIRYLDLILAGERKPKMETLQSLASAAGFTLVLNIYE